MYNDPFRAIVVEEYWYWLTAEQLQGINPVYLPCGSD